MDVAFLVCTACGVDAQSIPEVRSGYPDNRLHVIATVGISEGQLLVVPHQASCWRLNVARVAGERTPLATVAVPSPAPSITNRHCAACRIPDHDTCSLTPGCPCCEDTTRSAGGTAVRPYVDPTTDEWVGEYETRDADGQVTRQTEWFATEAEARRFGQKGPAQDIARDGGTT